MSTSNVAEYLGKAGFPFMSLLTMGWLPKVTLIGITVDKTDLAVFIAE